MSRCSGLLLASVAARRSPNTGRRASMESDRLRSAFPRSSPRSSSATAIPARPGVPCGRKRGSGRKLVLSLPKVYRRQPLQECHQRFE